jgi:Na+(H+)/acetate symporter ActP
VVIKRQSHASRLNGVFPLFSASRPARPARTVAAIARIILAVMLVIVVLAGVAPLSSLSSSHACSMACCAGKPPHMAGSCSVHLGDEEKIETPPAPGDEISAAHAAHAMHLSGATSVTTAATHHAAAKHSSGHHSGSKRESARTISIASQTMMGTPCLPECTAAATATSQVRRPRESALLTVITRPRPPTRLFFAGHFSKLLPESAERRRLSRPRAPPFRLVTLSA